MELPYQTYERITGKKWTGGKSPEVQSLYTQYGITAPAASAEANLVLQKALLGQPANKPLTQQEKPVGAPYMPPTADTKLATGQDDELSKQLASFVNKRDNAGSVDLMANLPKSGASQDTFDLNKVYEDAFKSAGLDVIKTQFNNLQTQIDKKQKQLNEAIGTVNENPWYSEASRVGHVRRLQELAQSDIDNLINQQKNVKNLFDEGVTQAKDLVNRTKQQYELNAKERELKLKESEELKKLIKEMGATSRETTIVDLYGQGITDPKKIFNYVNFDNKGNKIGDISLKEIKDALDVIDNQKNIEYPTSYKEWLLAGQPGTYAEWAQQKGGILADLNKILTPTEAQLFGVPYGTFAYQVTGIHPLAASQRESLTAFSGAKEIVKQINQIASKIITASNWTSALSQGVKLYGESQLKVDTDAAVYESKKQGLISLLTRALGEKGVLTDQDIARVRELLPSFRDTKAISERKISDLNQFISQIENETLAIYTNPIYSSQLASGTKIADIRSQLSSSNTNNNDPLGLKTPTANAANNDPLGLR